MATQARAADLVVVISEYTAREVMARLGVPQDRIVLCPPGAPAWAPRRPGPAGGPILYIGSAERRKNLPALLRAYARLRQADPDAPSLLLAGRPPDPGSDAAAMLQRPGVRHLGYVTDAERQRLYAEASMLVLPSLDEGFGMPVLEAMTIGVPVVASNRGALPEVAGDAGTLVDPLDEEALAAAMSQVLSSPARTSAAVARGFEQARRFSWSASAARLLRAYGEAVTRRRQAA